MRRIIVTTILVAIFSLSAFSQKEPNKKLPPMKMLPKNGEVKHIYELPKSMDYKIYDVKGNLVQSGNAEFIDYTNFNKGTYFILYGDKKEKFEVKD